MTPDQLDALCVVMRRHGVKRCGEVELFELAPPPDVGPLAPSKQAIGAEHGYPTAEEMLFASSPFPMTPEELKAKAPDVHLP